MLQRLRTHWPLVTWLALVLAFCAMAVAASLVTPFPGEGASFRRVQGWRTAWLDDAALVVSWTASGTVGALTFAAVALLLGVARRWTEAVTALALLAMEGVGQLAKSVIGRPRPLASLGFEAGNASFPSGHALHAFLLFAFLAWLLEGQVRPLWLLRLLQAALAVPILAVGVARVYQGYHWPADVLGSYLLGAIGLGVAVWAGSRVAEPRRR